MIYYTPIGKPLEENFRKYIKVLLNTTEFTKDLTHFILPSIAGGPTCLKKTFPVEARGEQAELIKIWSSFLIWDILVVDLNYWNNSLWQTEKIIG